MTVAALIVENGDCVADADSYVSESAFNDYLEDLWGGDSLRGKWQNLSSDDKRRLLKRAAKDLDCFNWQGQPCCDDVDPLLSNGRCLKWPRDLCGICALPKSIIRAQMFIAAKLLAASSAGASTSTTTGGDSVTVTSISLPGGFSASFGRNGAQLTLNGDECSPTITDGESSFELPDDLGCLIAPFLRKKVRRLQTMRVCK